MEEKIVVTNHIAQALIRIIFIWNRGTIVPFSIRRTCFETCISRASSHEENNELFVNFSLCRNKVSVSRSCSNKSSDLFANQIDRSVSTEKRRIVKSGKKKTNKWKCSIRFAKFSTQEHRRLLLILA